MRQPARTFQDLIVWQKAHQFVLSVYRITNEFPKSEIYGLTSQFRRAAISIPANIAEGFKKKGLADKAKFMNIAQGSLEECRYYNRSQEPEVRSQNNYLHLLSELLLLILGFQDKFILDTESWLLNSDYLILSSDLKYGDMSELMLLLEEVSKLLTSYSNSILTPGS